MNNDNLGKKITINLYSRFFYDKFFSLLIQNHIHLRTITIF